MDESQIVKNINRLLYPYILLFGLYLIYNGHLTPGGGFQGGAVLSAVFISRFLVVSLDDINMKNMVILEKLFITMLILFPMVSYFSKGEIFTNFMNIDYFNVGELYLILLNFIIGIKVACGLTLIFYCFIAKEVEI